MGRASRITRIPQPLRGIKRTRDGGTQDCPREPCAESAQGIIAMQDHILLVHEHTSPFPCPACDLGFPDITSILDHIENTHYQNENFLELQRKVQDERVVVQNELGEFKVHYDREELALLQQDLLEQSPGSRMTAPDTQAAASEKDAQQQTKALPQPDSTQ